MHHFGFNHSGSNNLILNSQNSRYRFRVKMQPEPGLSGNNSSNLKHLQIKLSVDAESGQAIGTILLQNKFSTLIEQILPAFWGK